MVGLVSNPIEDQFLRPKMSFHWRGCLVVSDVMTVQPSNGAVVSSVGRDGGFFVLSRGRLSVNDTLSMGHITISEYLDLNSYASPNPKTGYRRAGILSTPTIGIPC